MVSVLDEIVKNLKLDFGDFVPIANEENRQLEIIFLSRRKELQQLKGELEEQDTKWKDLQAYKKNLDNEHEENNKLLSYHKIQLETECDSNLLAAKEITQLDKEIQEIQKENDKVNTYNEKIQEEIADTLRKIENLRKNVGEERGALEEWNLALKKSEINIETLNKFSKEDKAKVNELDVKRRQLKIEHDRKQQELVKLCTDLEAEEKSIEKISNQIADALETRQQTVAKWNEAVETLQQRDNDILKLKQELEMLHEYASKKTTCLQEKNEFLESLEKNYKQIEMEMDQLQSEYEKKKNEQNILYKELKETENTANCTKKELNMLSKKLIETKLDNKSLTKEIGNKEEAIKNISEQISKYREKIEEITDGSKTAAQRQRQLEEMHNNEEKYIGQLQHDYNKLLKSIRDKQQKVTELKNEEREILIEIDGYKASLSQLDINEQNAEKELLHQDEIIYKLDMEIEALTTRLARLEGDIQDPRERELLNDRIQHLETMNKEETEKLNLLQIQISKLENESRLLTKNIEKNDLELKTLNQDLNNITAEVDGGEKELLKLKKNVRILKTEHAALNLKVVHIEKILKDVGEDGYNLQKAQIELECALTDKLNEINARETYNMARIRTLQDECGALQAQLKKEEISLEQLKKKYDILACSLGKDEFGEALSISYFKVKKAQEKAELQQEGDKLEAQICQSEKEIAALETTLQLMNSSNKQFIKSLNGSTKKDSLNSDEEKSNEDYIKSQETLKQITVDVQRKKKQIRKMVQQKNDLISKIEELTIKKDDLLEEIENIQKDLREQGEKLNRARISLKKSETAARKKVNNAELWATYKNDVKNNMLSEVNKKAIAKLKALNLPVIGEKAMELGMDLSQITTSELDLLINETDLMEREDTDQESSAQNLSIFSSTSYMEGLSDIGDDEAKNIIDSDSSTAAPSDRRVNINSLTKSETPVSITTFDFPGTSDGYRRHASGESTKIKKRKSGTNKK